MGQYFIIVNPAKGQYLDINAFGENPKASGYMLGLHAAAVGILCCDPSQVSADGVIRHDFGELAGSWCGDRIYAAGDDYGLPDDFGIVTATAANPQRNLYWLAKEEFDDITDAAIAMMCKGQKEYAEQFVDRAMSHSQDLLRLGRVSLEWDVANLEAALVQRLGANWRRLHKQPAHETAAPPREPRLPAGIQRTNEVMKQYPVVIVPVEGYAALLKDLRQGGYRVSSYSKPLTRGGRHELIRLGRDVPLDIASDVLAVASAHLPRLKYIGLSSDLRNDPPELVHQQIFLGADSTGLKSELRAFSSAELHELLRSKTTEELHAAIRAHNAKPR